MADSSDDTPCALFTSPTYIATIIYLWSVLSIFPFKVLLSYNYKIVSAIASWRLALLRCALLVACTALSATGLFFYGFLAYVSNDLLMFLEPSRPLPLPGIRRIPWFDAMIPHHVLSLVFFTVARFVADCEGITATMYIMLARSLVHEFLLLVYVYYKVAGWHWTPLSWACFTVLSLAEVAFVPVLWTLSGNAWAAVLLIFVLVDIECELVFYKLARFGTTRTGLRGPTPVAADITEAPVGLEQGLKAGPAQAAEETGKEAEAATNEEKRAPSASIAALASVDTTSDSLNDLSASSSESDYR